MPGGVIKVSLALDLHSKIQKILNLLMMNIKFYGHSGVKIEDDVIILIDPWLNDNPIATMKAEEENMIMEEIEQDPLMGSFLSMGEE